MELSVKDVMVGNYYYDGHEIDTITAGLMKRMEEGNIKGFQIFPIPLTEEWVLKFGFEPWNALELMFGLDAWTEDSRLDLDFNTKTNTVLLKGRYAPNSQSLPLPHVKYVHQLQNLYFTLTQKELQVKGSIKK